MGTGSGALPCQGFNVGTDMKGSSQAVSCKPHVLGVFLWVRDRGMYCGMYSFVCFSHLNKQKYSFIIREDGRSDEACSVKSCLLEKLSSFPLLNFSLKGGHKGWREHSYFLGSIFMRTRDEPSQEGAI